MSVLKGTADDSNSPVGELPFIQRIKLRRSSGVNTVVKATPAKLCAVARFAATTHAACAQV